MLRDLVLAIWTASLADWLLLFGTPLLAYVLFLYLRWAVQGLRRLRGR